MATKVTVRATDVTSHVIVPTLRYGPLELGNRIGAAQFTLKSTAPFQPTDEDYVEITDTDGATRLFSGLVRMPAQTAVPGRDRTTDVVAQGWGAMSQRILVTATETYAAGKSDVEIVSDLLTKYYGPIATSVTHTILCANPNMPALSFAAGAKTLYDALEAVSAAAFNTPWYIDADKKLHWNDVNRLAPFALSDVADGSTARTHRDCVLFRDATAAAARVRVIGTAVEYTATDWGKIAQLNLRNADQPGAAAIGFYQLPDVTDTTLTTVDQCKQRAWAELSKVEGRTLVTTKTYSTGLVPGMRIDIIVAAIGTRTTPHPQPRSRHVAMTAAKQLYKGMGRFTVQRVTPRALSLDQWEITIDAGAYEPQLDTALARL